MASNGRRTQEELVADFREVFRRFKAIQRDMMADMEERVAALENYAMAVSTLASPQAQGDSGFLISFDDLILFHATPGVADEYANMPLFPAEETVDMPQQTLSMPSTGSAESLSSTSTVPSNMPLAPRSSSPGGTTEAPQQVQAAERTLEERRTEIIAAAPFSPISSEEKSIYKDDWRAKGTPGSLEEYARKQRLLARLTSDTRRVCIKRLVEPPKELSSISRTQRLANTAPQSYVRFEEEGSSLRHVEGPREETDAGPHPRID